MLEPPSSTRFAELDRTPLPQFAPLRRSSGTAGPAPLLDIEAAAARAVGAALVAARAEGQLRAGARVVVAVGSRHLSGLRSVVAATVRQLTAEGCKVTVLAAMGSHGGGTRAGQIGVLKEYGITEASVGAPVEASEEFSVVGTRPDGTPVRFNRVALEADGLVLINRVKPHTDFHGEIESGLSKMLAVGLGGPQGAAALHRDGFGALESAILEARRVLLGLGKLAFGVATVEDERGRVVEVEAIAAKALERREPELLERARVLMPTLPVERLDLLIVQAIGKDVSGAGMDPNITGRSVDAQVGKAEIGRIVVLGLTPASKGNAMGLGMADVTTARVAASVDLSTTWVNCFSSTSLASGKIPIFMPTARQAIAVAVRACPHAEPDRIRAAWIQTTRALDEVRVSPAVCAEALASGVWEPAGPPAATPFDGNGDLDW